MSDVLFVGADAEPTLRAVRLLRLVTRLGQLHPDAELRIVLLRGGPLVHAFRAVAPTTVIDWDERADHLLPAAGLIRHPRPRAALARALEAVATVQLRRGLRRLRPRALVFDGLAALVARPGLPARARREIVLLAEGDVAVAPAWSSDVDRWMAAADVVLDSTGSIPGAGRAERAAPRPEPDGSLVVGGFGPDGWRGGADLFLRMADRLRAAHPGADVRFAWAAPSHEAVIALRDHAGVTGLTGLVDWATVDDPAAWISRLDVLALTARTGDTDLAGVEAAAAGVAVVAFAGAGLDELAGARTAAYPDVDCLAAEVGALCDDATVRRALGAAGARSAADRLGGDDLAVRTWAALAGSVG